MLEPTRHSSPQQSEHGSLAQAVTVKQAGALAHRKELGRAIMIWKQPMR